MGRTSDRHGRLEPLLFFLVSALILVARVAYHPLPNWTNYDAVGAKQLELRSSSRKGVRGGATGQTGQLHHKVVGSFHSKRQIYHTRRANGQMLAAVFDRTIHRVRNELGKPSRRRMRMESAPAPAPAPAPTKIFAGSVAVRGFQVVSSVVDKLGQLSLEISVSPSPSSTFSIPVDPTVQRVVVTALPATFAASMSVNGQLVTAGRPSNPIPILVGGVTHLTIALASPSGAATLFYTPTLLQPASPAPSPSLLAPQPLSVDNDFQPAYSPAAAPSPVPLTPTSTTTPSTPLSPTLPAVRFPILPPSSLVGVAYDGYLANCVLFADANLNGVQDASETGTSSGPLGQFVLGGYTGGPIILNPQAPVNKGAQNCTDVNTGVQLVGAISAPPSSTSVSPLSSILWQVMMLLPDLSQSEVNRIVTNSLQIDGTDLATCDPIAVIAGVEVGGAALARATLIRLAQVQSAVTLGAAFLGRGGAFGSAAVSQALAQALVQTFHPLAPPSAHVATGGRRKLWRRWQAERGPRMVRFEAGGGAQQGLAVDLTDPTHIYGVLTQSATLIIHTGGPAALAEGTQAIAVVNAELDSLLNQTLTGNQFLTAVFATSAVAQGLWVNRIRQPPPATSSSFTSLSKAQFLEDLAYTLETNPAVAAQGSRAAATAPPTAPNRAPVPTLLPPPAPSSSPHSGGATGWWASPLWLKVAFCAAVGVAAFLLLFIFCTRCLPCCCSCCYQKRGRRSKPPLPPRSAPGPRAALHRHLDCLGLPGGSAPSSPSSIGNPGQHWGGSRVSEIEVVETSHLGRRVPFFGFGPPLPASDDRVALVPSGPSTSAQNSSAISLCSSNSTPPSFAVGEDGNPIPPAPPLSQALLQRLGLRGGRLSPWEEGEGNSGAFSYRAEADHEEREAEESVSSESQSDAHWVTEVEEEQEQAITALPVMAPRRAERSPEGAGGRGEDSPPLLHGRSRLGLPTSVTEEGAGEAAEMTGERQGAEEEKETGEVIVAHGPGWEAAYVAERLESLKSGASRLRRERFGGDQILRPGTWEPLEMDTRRRSGGEGPAPVEEES